MNLNLILGNVFKKKVESLHEINIIKSEPDEPVTHIIRCQNCSKNFPFTDQQFHAYMDAYEIRRKQLNQEHDSYRPFYENAHCCSKPDYYWGMPLGEEKKSSYWKKGGLGRKQSEL